MTTRGISTPINYLLLLSIAILVFTTVFILFTGVTNPGEKSFDCQGEFRKVCIKYTMNNCCEDPTTDACQEIALPSQCSGSFSLQDCCPD